MTPLAIVSDAFTAATTAKIGFAYVDGVDSTSVPQDDDYFFLAGLATNALVRTRSTNTGVAPITLPKDAYVILTNAGAAHASVGVLTCWSSVCWSAPLIATCRRQRSPFIGPFLKQKGPRTWKK